MDLLQLKLSTLVLSTSLLLLLLLLLWLQGPRWLSHSCSGATYEGKSLCAVWLYHQQGVLQLLPLHRPLEKDSVASCYSFSITLAFMLNYNWNQGVPPGPIFVNVTFEWRLCHSCEGLHLTKLYEHHFLSLLLQ